MDPTVKRLDALVSMTKMAFREGHLPVDITWTNMVLLLKERGYYKYIGMVEMLWNMIVTIINTRLRVSISLHNNLHGFR